MKTHKSTLRYALWGEIANILQIFAELLLMAVWMFALTFAQIPWSKIILISGSVFLITYLLARWLHQLKLKLVLQRVIFIGWISLAVAFSAYTLLFSQLDYQLVEYIRQIFIEDVSTDTIIGFWILLFTLLVISRGIRTARHPVTTSDIVTGLKISLLLFSLFAVLFAKENYSEFLPTFFAFLLVNLTGMSLARISDLSDHYGGRVPGFNFQWAAGIGLTSLVVVFAGRVISWIINLKAAEFLGKGLVLFVQFIIGAVVLVASPILLGLVALLEFILNLLSPNLKNLLGENQIEIGEQFLDEMQTEIVEVTRVDPIIFVMIGVLLVIVIVAIIQLRQKPWERSLLGEENRSDLQRQKRMPNPLKDLFANRAARKKLSTARSLLAAARVRYIYTQLLDLCEKLGKPRPRALTPIEFIPRMQGLFPQHPSELTTITDAYVRIRYGELPETSKDIEDVVTAWQNISTYAKEILDERKKQMKRSSTYRTHN